MPYTPQIALSVTEFLENIRDVPSDELSQSEAESTLVDIAEQITSKSEAEAWSWISCFCEEGGMSDVFEIAQDAGGEDHKRGALVRGLLAFEVVGVALGNASVLDVVSLKSHIVKEFVLKYDRVHARLVSASLRTLCRVALHSVRGHFAVIAAIQGAQPAGIRTSIQSSPRWEALVDVLSRPKTKKDVKRDILCLFNVLITTGPTVEERIQLRRVLNKVGFEKTIHTLKKWSNQQTDENEIDDADVSTKQLISQITLYHETMFDDVRALDRLCRYAGLKILWSKGDVVERNNEDTRNAKNRLKKNQKNDNNAVGISDVTKDELKKLAGNGPGSVKLMKHVDALVTKNNSLLIEIEQLRSKVR